MSLDFTIAFPPRNSAPEKTTVDHPHLKSISQGIASSPSKLEAAHREQVDTFFNLSFFDSFYDNCLSFLRRFLPCLFPRERSIIIPDSPITASIIDQRVLMGKNYLQNQLRPRVNRDANSEWTPYGITESLIQNSKVIVILKYNGMTESCYINMNGPASLEMLKQIAMTKLENLIRNPNNRDAHLTELNITTHTYSWPRLDYLGEPCHALNDQGKSVTINPDNSIGESSGGGDGFCSGVSKASTVAY